MADGAQTGAGRVTASPLPPAGSLTGSIWTMGQSLTLSLCSMNSARFKRVCVTSAISCEVRANSMLLMSSSCWSSFSSDQQDTNAALKRSLEAEKGGERRGDAPAWCTVTPFGPLLASLTLAITDQSWPAELAGNDLCLPCPIWSPLITEALHYGECD